MYISTSISNIVVKNTHISQRVPAFHGRALPEPGCIVGYGALIAHLELALPIPDVLAMISDKNKKYEVEGWKVFTPRHKPQESLYKHLVFALKYEGINLLFFKKMFDLLSREEVTTLLQLEPTGIYTRKMWFLYEWLTGDRLDIPDLTIKKSIPLIDEKLQFAIQGTTSARHRIINNLPGTPDFCPLIRKTETLEDHISKVHDRAHGTYLEGIRKDILMRASAFLLLKDSKASFTIEGESPKSQRAARWGQALGQAGSRDLSREELERLQQLVIANSRFVDMGFRKKGGFVGEHDRMTGSPLPDHISAKWQDLDQLMSGLIQTNSKLISDDFDAVLAATMVSFGFVFIHPFEDGNGRIHRYLIHHVLSKKGFSQQGMIFPVSASILNHLADYRQVLEAYSHPVLEHIDWKETADHNVEVLNDTMDYYRYFDATKQAEFLYQCVEDTIENIIPEEVNYLIQYDEFKNYLDNEFEMPDKMVALLVRILEQNEGRFSKRARENEFDKLTDTEISDIESRFKAIFKETS
jgi:hypothetical protein